ncbi:2-amino-4-hydroxy-6-hydroxymethyldihydropteridine pyrophosphokinase [Methylophaga thiooxydans]|uniref:2-amino-4-hydroxy-6-hydroxymethyldihydropteridine pyrophosphokinase n=1 Tax=Methylophaga thiooxydans TaxID=392484 RepID=A0A0A0BD94_9GAMM|nr:2-amino-4-hydroxy-6-hydroxymethyldihydropteridine diphosphokinase [Methylophaga thiooxydans]KGM05795.1 2-amino-4-hydroxy-6-hydroxymethyldihydropteridine pyrophosphokinase [Methylophaga thiooxydans]
MRVYIGLGSNLDNPQTQIKTAIDDIAQLAQTTLVQTSSLYKSPPMGPQDQPDYINAVVSLDTHLSAHALLDALQAIEQSHGRIRKRHWGERTLDLDILLFADQVINDERLNVPHPGISDRPFVLYPLAEIAPNLNIPQRGNIKQLQKTCPPEGLDKVENSAL